MDDQLKVLGYRVEPGEVEGVLASAPGVLQAAVVVDRRGQDVRLVGFVRANAPYACEPFLAEVRAHLRNLLPTHMVPDVVVLIDELPVNANGKVDRGALQLPEVEARQPSTSGEQPKGYWHSLVHSAWAHTLNREGVPSYCTFFEAGGTSLMLIKLSAALTMRGVTGLSVTDLFRFPTIDDLASHLASRASENGGKQDAAFDRAAARRKGRERARSRRNDR